MECGMDFLFDIIRWIASIIHTLTSEFNRDQWRLLLWLILAFALLIGMIYWLG